MNYRKETPGKLFYKVFNSLQDLEDLYIHLIQNQRNRFYLKSFVENIRNQSDSELKYRDGYEQKQELLNKISEFIEMLLEVVTSDALSKLSVYQLYLARKYNLLNSEELTLLFRRIPKEHTIIIESIISKIVSIDTNDLVYYNQAELHFLREYLENIQTLIKRVRGDEELEEFNRKNSKLTQLLESID